MTKCDHFDPCRIIFIEALAMTKQKWVVGACSVLLGLLYITGLLWSLLYFCVSVVALFLLFATIYLSVRQYLAYTRRLANPVAPTESLQPLIAAATATIFAFILLGMIPSDSPRTDPAQGQGQVMHDGDVSKITEKVPGSAASSDLGNVAPATTAYWNIIGSANEAMRNSLPTIETENSSSPEIFRKIQAAASTAADRISKARIKDVHPALVSFGTQYAATYNLVSNYATASEQFQKRWLEIHEEGNSIGYVVQSGIRGFTWAITGKDPDPNDLTQQADELMKRSPELQKQRLEVLQAVRELNIHEIKVRQEVLDDLNIELPPIFHLEL